MCVPFCFSKDFEVDIDMSRSLLKYDFDHHSRGQNQANDHRIILSKAVKWS